MTKVFVFDTNSLISASLIGKSISAAALDRAIQLGLLAVCTRTMEEFVEVLFRKKFDRYFLNDPERWAIIERLQSAFAPFTPIESITACRDPKDDKFLELAVAANAACIVSGDDDLLTLHPFRGIPILKAADFILQF